MEMIGWIRHGLRCPFLIRLFYFFSLLRELDFAGRLSGLFLRRRMRKWTF